MVYKNTIILIVGLPGSGKSNLAKQINKDNDGKYKIINDPKEFEEIKSHIFEDLIVTDPHLIFENNRKMAINKIKELNPDCKIEWIFFENDPEQCLINSNIRNRSNAISLKPIKKVDSFIKNFSEFYTIPRGSFVVKVWKR